MLEKIVEINNVGRFRAYAARGDVALRKLTLIYAENGRGKTTLCSVLRSLKTGLPEFISERKTLAAAGSSSVHLRLGGADYHFAGSAWNATYPDIIIFDPVFVAENVYSGERVEHEHRKNLYLAIVGAAGVQLAGVIEDLDYRIREVNADIRDGKRAIEACLPAGVIVDTYVGWKPVEDIADKIQQKVTETAVLQAAADRTSEILTKGLLSKIALPSLPSNLETILAKPLKNAAAEAETMVRKQVADHRMGVEGEGWLSQGLEYVADDLCPFCGQDVESNDLIAAYRSHFDAAYKALKAEVEELGESVTTAIGEAALNAMRLTVSDNLTLVAFWKQFTQASVPSLPFEDIQSKYDRLWEAASALARRKQQDPIEVVSVSGDLTRASSQVETLRQPVDKYNSAVDACNIRINEQKTAVQQGVDLSGARRQLADLEANRDRFAVDMVKSCQSYLTATKTKADLEQEKVEAREQLDEHCRSIVLDYEGSINHYLDQFNVGFRITNSRHLYTGGTPSSHYQVEINSTAVDLGDARTPAGTPCFRTALSTGDRGALALAFFMALLKQDAAIGGKIVVFDDPFTSLDRFRRTCTQQLIGQLSDSAEQVIVLSHDPYFLKLVWDEWPQASASAKALQMSKHGATTIVGEWDIDAEVQTGYMKDYSTLLKYYRERKGTAREVARTIRPFLESWLTSHFPGHFLPSEWLGDFIDKVRRADSASGLQHARADLSELEAINDYSKKYHHAQNANADQEPIDEDELHGYVKRTLRFVGVS